MARSIKSSRTLAARLPGYAGTLLFGLTLFLLIPDERRIVLAAGENYRAHGISIVNFGRWVTVDYGGREIARYRQEELSAPKRFEAASGIGLRLSLKEEGVLEAEIDYYKLAILSAKAGKLLQRTAKAAEN